jgi:6-phosphofructokinase
LNTNGGKYMALKTVWLSHRVNLEKTPLATLAARAGTGNRKTYGLLHAGGPAPASNAAIAGVVHAANIRGISIFGFQDGIDGVKTGTGILLTPGLVDGLQHEGGVAIGTARTNPRKPEERAALIANLKRWGIEGMIFIGGDDTNTTATRFFESGFPTVGIPKTIDNDIPGTSITHGWMSAYDSTSRVLKALKYDAQCQNQPSIFIVQVMGRKNGSWAFESGRAAGATAMFIPEEFRISGLQQIIGSSIYDPAKNSLLNRIANMVKVKGQDISGAELAARITAGQVTDQDIKLTVTKTADVIASIMKRRIDSGHDGQPGPSYGVFVLSEGLSDKLHTEVHETDTDGLPKSFIIHELNDLVIKADEHHNPRLSDVKIAHALNGPVEQAAQRLGYKLKVVSQEEGYSHRCIPPIDADANLGLSEGSVAVELLATGRPGNMVCIKGYGNISSIPFAELPKDETGHLKPRYFDLSGADYASGVVLQAWKADPTVAHWK